ncbi:MAG TPA: immune inhibitor A domain-containing protein [Jiangellaceae bacterium]
MGHRRFIVGSLALGSSCALVLGASAAVSGSSPDLSAGSPGSPTSTVDVSAGLETGSQWINTVAPQFEAPTLQDVKATPGALKATTLQQTALEQAWEYDRKNAGGNPKAARQLARAEQTAIRTGKSPRQIKQAKDSQVAKLLTILVEFNPDANDDFSGVMVPKTVFEDRTCVPGDVQNGPLHNNIPNPADAPFPDNNTFWVPDFSSEHFNKLLYTSEGITERVRPDLTGPDGEPGIDISGYTMRNHYLEMSKGAYSVEGAATPWVTVAHSEAWYGADRCTQDEQGNWVAGPPQRMVGHPDNPRGPGQLAIDAVVALQEQVPDFPFEEYDIEDQFDRDGDGDLFEPDGFIDHVVLVHAGEDKSGGGGTEGVYAIWAHSSDVPGGAPIPGTDLRLENYIVQPEDSGVGVFSHEYGHDLGLPDLYDTSGAASSHIEFWDLMSSGSHSGPIFQAIPTHMGIWDKWVLGWAEPVVLDVDDDPQSVVVGQTSRTPRGTQDGVQVRLPDKIVSFAEPHSGENMWWSNNDQNWADVRLERDIAVPAGADVRFWMWNDYIIEDDWDYGFIEVSADGGATWEEQKVYDEAGNLVSTDDDYADPNGRMTDYGGKKYGLTSHTDGWRHDYVDLTAFAGQNIKLRMRYATDAAFLERGWFIDDLSLTADGTTVWEDDAETNNGWTPEVSSFTNTAGQGWVIDPGTHARTQYYMAEWRNLDGFDEGLKYGYDSTYTPTGSGEGAWWVSKVNYNAPGMLVWYRDTSYSVNHVSATSFDLPSVGSKGQLLIVESHFDPMRHTGDAAAADPSVLKNFPVRMNASDAAFTTFGTYEATDCFTVASPTDEYCTTYGNKGAVESFTDELGWYPGIEIQPQGLFFRDIDASAVIPSRDNEPYTTRMVNPDGSPAEDLYGLSLGGGHFLGTGNPGDEGKEFGVSFTIRRTDKSNQSALVYVTPATR